MPARSVMRRGTRGENGGVDMPPVATQDLQHPPTSQATRSRRDTLADRYRRVRAASEKLCETLVPEDYVVQSMPDVSPTKWHLAHTSWFWETFLLKPHRAGYREFNSHFAYLFNSY